MQPALAFDPEEPQQPGPEAVPGPAAAAPAVQEQLPLVAMLQVVHDRVELIHAGQRTLTAEVRDIKANLPLQRKALSKRAQEVHIRATWLRRNGLCPCCQETPVCYAAGRLEGAEFDHWFSRAQSRVTQTWLVCRQCNQRLVDTDFKSVARSAFEAYQQAIRPFIGKQIPLGLGAAAGASS